MNKKLKVSFVILSALLIFLLLYKTFYTEGSNEDADVAKEVSTETNDTSIGTMLGLTDNTAVSHFNETFHLENGGSFKPTIDLYNKDIKNNKFRLLFILDYKSADVIYNSKTKSYIDLELKPNETKKLNITVPDLPDGIHDFIIFSIRRPDDLLTKDKYFPPGHFNLFKRATLVVGNSQSTEKVNYTQVNTINNNADISPILTKKPTGDISKALTLIHKETLSEPLWLNFSNKKANKYSVLVFENNKKLAYKNFLEANEDGVVSLPLNLNSTNKQNIFAAVIENPYSIRENLNKSNNNIDWFINTANRVTSR
ncbi:hypothetical protein [Priestia megaterium]|uniref:hypothetical protein n=1 Tax=Priestia megaterium TaxID=1404 RepID=UPI00366DB1E0